MAQFFLGQIFDTFRKRGEFFFWNIFENSLYPQKLAYDYTFQTVYTDLHNYLRYRNKEHLSKRWPLMAHFPYRPPIYQCVKD